MATSQTNTLNHINTPPTDFTPKAGCLNDRVIIVTGAGDGIGKCAAMTFAKYGATIVLVGRTMPKLEAVYDAIEANNGPKPAIFPMNFEAAVEQDFQALFSALENEFGRIDGLLHNAGELGPRTPLANYPLDAWEKLLQIHLTAPFTMTKTLLPLLKASKDASIVYTSAPAGRNGTAYTGAYGISKAAGEHFVKTFADELDDAGTLRINSINPIAAQTALRAKEYPAEDPTTVPHPETRMKTYLYLLSQASHGVNGQQFDAQP